MGPCRQESANAPKERQGEFGIGEVWTFTALDPDTKLIVTWMVGRRTTARLTNAFSTSV